MSNKLLYLLAFFCLAFSIPTVFATHSNQQIIAISDIHFDPFMGCHLQKYCSTVKELQRSPIEKWDSILARNKAQLQARLRIGMDTNYALLTKLIKQVKPYASQPNNSFMIITGDYLAHNIDKNYHLYFKTSKGYQVFIRKVFRYLYAKLRTICPANLGVYFVMGNNDGYLGDYVINADQQFFKDISLDWSELNEIASSGSKIDHQLLSRNGSYARNITPSLKLIVLNTLIFLKKAKGENKEAHAQLIINWLNKQLARAKQKHQKVILAYHIPQSVAPTKRLLSPKTANLWLDDINQAYIKLAQQYDTTIIGMLHGHVHRPEFMRLHRDPNHPLPQYLISSVSPIFGNSPSFTIFTLTSDKLSSKVVTF
jgi:UDP-2,3-diacylglucosamine pyrophosphatase LpxH